MAIILNSAVPEVRRGFGQDIVKRSMEVTEEKNKSSSSSHNLNSNHFRGKVLKENFENLKPNRVYVKRYENYLADAYTKTLRLQLNRRFRYASGTHKHVGYATGKLSKSITTVAKVRFYKNKANKRLDIKYKLVADYSDYGVHLNNERSSKTVPLQVIRRWILVKEKQGSFRLRSKPSANSERAGKNSRQNRLKSIASAIQKKWADGSNPAVLKDWSNYDKNKRLRDMFAKEIKRKSIYYRNQIRKGIIKNINK